MVMIIFLTLTRKPLARYDILSGTLSGTLLFPRGSGQIAFVPASKRAGGSGGNIHLGYVQNDVNKKLNCQFSHHGEVLRR